MIFINHYHSFYYYKLDSIYNNFNDSDKSYEELLYLIYKIYYSENILIYIDDGIKYSLNSILNLIINKYNIYIDFSQDKKQLYKNYIVLINKNTNFSNNFDYDEKFKKTLEKFLYLNNIISSEDIYSSFNVFKKINNEFNNENIRLFFEKNKVNFEKSFLNIGSTIIPNFLLYKKNLMIDHQYEFFHLLFKIYAPIIYYGVSFYEGYEYNISEKDVVFDCGGNMGLFALYCASKGAKVYCFEPMSYIRDFLNISKSIYPDNIYIIPYGLSNDEKEEYFYQGYNPGASKNINYDLNTSELIYKEKCKVITLDDFCNKNNIFPTFIKADIEGAELQMLEGASNIIKEKQPVLSICLNHREMDQYTIPSFIYQLNSDYSFYYILEGVAQSKFVLCKNNA